MTLNLSLSQLVLAASMVLVAMAISTWQHLGLTKSLAIGAVRGTVQLIFMGYVLVTVFRINEPLLIGLLMVLMVILAAHTAAGRQKENKGDKKRVAYFAFISILISTTLTLFFVSQVVIDVDPWYSPQYLIPLAGMVIANSMNAAALGAERFASELCARRHHVEALLALGASPKEACEALMRKAVGAAMMPTISALMVVGLVSLPGMMSGQILSGVSPLLAVRYQLVVQFMIVSAAAMTSVMMVIFYARSFFDHEAQSLDLNCQKAFKNSTDKALYVSTGGI